MPKISELPATSTVGNTAVWPVLENNAVQKISFANFKSAVNTPATTTVLGAVKIGTGISVSSEGLISVTIPTASSGTIGGVKVASGSNLTVNGSGVLSLKDNITFGNGSRINATNTDVLEITSTTTDGVIRITAGDEIFSQLVVTNLGISLNSNVEVTGNIRIGNQLESTSGQLILKSDNGYFRFEGIDGDIENVTWLDVQPGNTEFTTGTYINFLGDVRIGQGIAGTYGSTPGSFSLPKYTTESRNNKTVLQDGELIYNTTLNKVQAYANGVWVDLH